MTWKTVRLELARAAGFPRGSASRAYILRVPLNEDGSIDAETLAQAPTRATARRFWSPEPDRYGRVERCDGHWLLRCSDQHGESLSRMLPSPLRLHNEITIEEPDGSTNPFRVASITSNGPTVAVAS